MESTCTGLGFNHTSLDGKRKHDDSNADSLMSRYMKSCLDYHKQQEQNEIYPPSGLPSFIPATENATIDVSRISNCNQDMANGINANKKIERKCSSKLFRFNEGGK